MDGLYLAEPHGSLTYSGRKNAVAKNQSHPEFIGTHILVSGGHADGKAYGEVTIAEETELTRDEFKARFSEHRISTKELERWWPEDETLFLYSFTFVPYERPLPVEVPPGVQTLMGEVKFKKLEEGAKMPQPGKNESQDDFVSRCIPIVLKDKTAKDQKQAAAICFQTWRDAKKKKAKKQEVGGPEKCACPKCDYTTEKERGTPCRSMKCPECGAMLVADVGEKAGRRVRSSKRQIISDIIAKLKEVLSWANYEDEVKSAVKLYEHEGKTYIVTWTTNSFIDRDGEIFTDKSIKEYIARHKDDEVKGELKYRHIDGSKFGNIIFQAMSGRFLVEASVFDDNAVGQAFKQLFKQYPDGHPTVSPEGWGCSHGYLYEGVDREDGVYEWFEKKETSVLPASVASNPHNPGVEVIQMDQKSKDELTAIVGAEVTDQVAATGQALTKKKEDEGVACKETEVETEVTTEVTEEPKAEKPEKEGEPKVEPVEEPKPEEKDEVPALVGKEMVKAIADAVAEQFDMGSLSTAFKSLTDQLTAVNQKVDAVVTRLDEVERSDEERLAEKELQLPRFPWSDFQPSQAKETEIKDGDPIKEKVPTEVNPAIQFLANQVTK